MGDSRGGLTVPEESVKRACDQCHSRKVKCDGQKPCARCGKKRITCSFQNPVLPKGPAPWSEKPRRARRHRPYQHERPDSAAITLTSPPALVGGTSSAASSSTSTSPPDIISSSSSNTNKALFSSFDILDSTSASVDEALEDAVTTLIPWTTTTSTEFSFDSWPMIGNGSSQQCAPTGNIDTTTFPVEDNWLRMLLQTRPSSPAPAAPGTFDFALEQASPIGLPQGSLAQNPFNNAFINAAVNNPPIYNMPFTTPEDASPILTLTLESLIRPQLDTFYDRIYPMMPVFPPSYLFARLADPVSLGQPDFVALILAKCAMSLIHPLLTHEMPQRPMRLRQAKILLDEACRLLAKWNYGCQVTLEAVMASYLMFGILFEMGQTAGAKLRLKEAIAMGETMELNLPTSYHNLGTAEVKRRMRMYWVLAVTERVWALQRRGAITFTGPIKRAHEPNMHSACLSIYYLTELFSHFDRDIVACWNEECPRGSGGQCHTLTAKRAVDLLSKLKASAPKMDDNLNQDLNSLNDSQKADLFITWQWARNRIWKLCSTHGLTKEGAQAELSVEYIVDVAATTVGICKRLPLAAMEAHGTGFVEKIYDIGAVLTALLKSTDPDVQAKLIAIVQTNVWGETLQSLYAFLSVHRGGSNDFAADLGQAIRYTGLGSSATGLGISDFANSSRGSDLATGMVNSSSRDGGAGWPMGSQDTAATTVPNLANLPVLQDISS